jgi:hypothetical protein
MVRIIGTALVARVARAVTPIEPVAAILPLWTFLALLAFGTLVAVGAFALGRFSNVLIALVVVHILVAAWTLILETGAAFAEHPEIVIRILQIIFRLHAVAGELRVARHALVFLQELGGVAPLAIVLAVARLSAEVPASALSTLSASAAPAATLSIVYQMPTSLRSELAPLGIGQQGRCFWHRLLTLSFRSAHQAPGERPIASGVGSGCALQLSWWSGPGPDHDVVCPTSDAKSFRSNPG